MFKLPRRNFLGCGLSAVGAAMLPPGVGERAASAADDKGETNAAEPILDIHQHLDYSGRSDEQLLAHQRKLGITQTILLPAGRLYGLEAKIAGNERAVAFAAAHAGEYVYFANETPYLSAARAELEKYLKAGGRGIGEQKFMVESDSGAVHLVAEIAQSFGVPVLLHFQEGRYNTSFANFRRVLEKFPKVNFIGHAQSWWANIAKEPDPADLYPKGPVAAGGLTDQWLREFPNMYGDMSAGSGLNAFTRDERHAVSFMERHQDKLLFGSDCSDAVAEGDKCTGFQIIQLIRRLAPSKMIERKLLYENAKKLMRL